MQQIRGEATGIRRRERGNGDCVEVVCGGRWNSGSGQFAENVMQTDGACEDDAKPVVFDAETAEGIEHFGGGGEPIIACDAFEHPGNFVPEEYKFFFLRGFHQIGNGGGQQLLPAAAFEVDVVRFVVFEHLLDEVFGSGGAAQKLLDVVVDEFSEFVGGVNAFEDFEEWFPAGLGLDLHFAEDLCFSDTTFGVDEDALGFESFPEDVDEIFAAVDAIGIEVSAGVGFHEGGAVWGLVWGEYDL